MTEAQPPNVVEGATTGDFEDEQSQKPSSAEDRKAASALASLDAAAPNDTGKAAQNVDQAAVNKAMGGGGGGGGAGGASRKTAAAAPKKSVKVDAADVSLLVDQLLLAKPKATELLKAHDGDAVKAMRAYVAA
ncbi:uncharacterized protein F5Z01DRAFT_651140 [Emericellopsis atlantica]|uniref:Nascent polypeptide-associated complex subunit alpha-like UBA domain-containing protein n=1 Tax=Emericellopsis atlantica TaxID=2614577 RepID=A0A9P7ZR32_9HYPO|nr:uncharacterized protein F5Z01DRAFT_651140 [Emericellopsis atlantica]KAG9256130.1 hypothetical protein F5Z01DRAFT_651140 [Emericellopsis atlantica]